MPLVEAGMQGDEASLVSVVHQMPHQEAMGAKSSEGKGGRHNFVLHQRIVSQTIDSERGNKKVIGFSLRFLAAV